VLRGIYLRGFELQAAGVLWKSLWNCWQLGESLAVKICQAICDHGFLASKALNSNQLGNSLRINIVKTSEKAAYSRFADLHIWRSMTFRLVRSWRTTKQFNCCLRRP
jgi:hypothetical protein